MAYDIKQKNSWNIDAYSGWAAAVNFLDWETGTFRTDSSQYKEVIPRNADLKIVKLSYSCDPSKAGFPFYLSFDGGTYQEFYPGKYGVYDINPETYRDENGEEHEAKVRITGAQVPCSFPFVLTYAEEVN